LSKLKRFLTLQNKGHILKLQTKAIARRMGDPRLVGLNLKWLRYRYNLSNQPTYPAPYDVSLYKQLLQALNRAEIKRGPLSGCRDETGYVVLRHDLDFKKCVENVELMTQIEASLNVRSSLMVRVDNLDYHPRIAEKIVIDHYQKGFEVGVHSTAYMLDNPMQGLLEEFRYFEELYGIKPRVYNFHGGFDEHLGARIKLGLQSNEILAKYPDILETDSISGFYAYRFSDCLKRDGSRVIGSDFLSPPTRTIKKSRVPVLLLTHPCYWEGRKPSGEDQIA